MSGKRMGSMRLIWLEAFVLAVELESFTKAGVALGVDQGTASRYITELEKWLGSPLTFTGTTELTPAGEHFIAVARQVVALLSAAKEQPLSKAAISAPISPKDLKI